MFIIFLPILILLPILIFSAIIHECAHGWVAERYGDPTARLAGRITLNPIPHIDPVGTILLPILLFIMSQGRVALAYAKPVPVNFRNLRNPKEDMMKVGAAGPLANIVLALCSVFLLKVLKISPASLGGQIIALGVLINILLAIFNLIPIPPLDGSRIIMGLLPPRAAYDYSRLEPFGIFIVLIALFVFRLIDPLFHFVIYLCQLLGVFIPI